MGRTIINIVFTSVALLGLVYSILLMYGIKSYGWSVYSVIFVFFPVTLIVVLTSIMLILARSNIVKNSAVVKNLNIFALFLLFCIIVATLSFKNGLWNEFTYRWGLIRLSPELMRNYYFNPMVGFIGIYLSSVSYISYKFMVTKNITLESLSLGKETISIAPLLGYFATIYLHRFIEKPYYNG